MTADEGTTEQGTLPGCDTARTSRMRLAHVLKTYRWAEKLTVRDMAKRLGVSAATLNRFEDGRGEMSGECMAKVLRWLLSRDDGAVS